VLARLGKPKEVLSDLQFLSVFEAPTEDTTELHDWAVKMRKKEQ
jgi:hypothetical protein